MPESVSPFLHLPHSLFARWHYNLQTCASYSPNGISYKNAAILYNRVKHSNLQLYFAVFLPRFS